MKFPVITLLSIGLILFSCGGQQDAPQQTSAAPAANPAPVPVVEEKPQTKEERIQEIKLWYAEVEKIGMQNCETKKRKRYVDSDSGKIPLDQVVSICKVNEHYELIKGTFLEFTSGVEVSIYKKDGKIFFVRASGGGDSWSYEDRYYCDRNENLIELFESEVEGGHEVKGFGKPSKLDSKVSKIQDNIAGYLADVNFVMAGK
jgi:hypothetical protein